MNDFNVVNIDTGKIEYSHDKSEMFKQPYVKEGNLHWFSYASDQVLVSLNRRRLNEMVLGYYTEWCKHHEFETKEPIITEMHNNDFKMTEFQFIAPIIKEGTIHEVHSSG